MTDEDRAEVIKIIYRETSWVIIVLAALLIAVLIIGARVNRIATSLGSLTAVR